MEDPVREAIDLIGLDGSKGREREKRSAKEREAESTKSVNNARGVS